MKVGKVLKNTGRIAGRAGGWLGGGMADATVAVGGATYGAARGVADFLSSHKKLAFGGAVALGIIAGNPFEGVYDGVVNEGMLGAPHATRTYMQAGVTTAVRDAFSTPSQLRYRYGGMKYTSEPWKVPEDSQRAVEGNFVEELPGYMNESNPIGTGLTPVGNSGMYRGGPSGDIVFGMYNMRI